MHIFYDDLVNPFVLLMVVVDGRYGGDRDETQRSDESSNWRSDPPPPARDDDRDRGYGGGGGRYGGDRDGGDRDRGGGYGGDRDRGYNRDRYDRDDRGGGRDGYDRGGGRGFDRYTQTHITGETFNH